MSLGAEAAPHTGVYSGSLLAAPRTEAAPQRPLLLKTNQDVSSCPADVGSLSIGPTHSNLLFLLAKVLVNAVF